MGMQIRDSSNQSVLPLPRVNHHASLALHTRITLKAMLNHLFIKDFAIIPSLELDFEPGFTAITGETGAGKSIMVDALGLLLGDRSDSSWVRQGADRAELSAEFRLEQNPVATQWLKETGLDSNGQCLLRRTIAANGRSRSWVNGSPVTVQQIGELGELLVEIHGQNEHVRLTRNREQYLLLDSSGHYQRQLRNVLEAFEKWKALRDEFERLEQQSGISPAELDYLQFQLEELNTHSIPAADVTSLEQEHRKLAQGGAMLDALQAGKSMLDAEHTGGRALIQSTLNLLAPYRELDPSIDESASMLAEAAINCEEAAIAILQACDKIDLSPGKLSSLADQLELLADLGRKHRVPMEDLQQVRDELAGRLEKSGNFEASRTELEANLAGALAQYRESAADLSKARLIHAKKLSGDVSALMSQLGMPDGTFDIRVQHDPQSPPSPTGDNSIKMLVSANPGTDPGPLSKVASGGELSRISLAIKVAAGYGRSLRTQIFDEVDTGIGGETANMVGKLLKTLATDTQVLCVTHLAQVAVCGQHQLQVRKSSSQDRTSIKTTVLNEDERIDEIARMLGGRVSDQSRKHATEMLAASGES